MVTTITPARQLVDNFRAGHADHKLSMNEFVSRALVLYMLDKDFKVMIDDKIFDYGRTLNMYKQQASNENNLNQ
jgi:hypothetical protein